MSVYTIESLSELNLPEIKAIAETVQARPTEDARKKKNWVNAIVEAVAGTVPAAEFENEPRPGHVPDTTEDAEPTDIENELLDEIERTGEAEQLAIMANDQEEARRLSDRVTELLDQYEMVIKAKIRSLAPSLDDLEASAPVAVQVNWAGDAVGTVTLDGGVSLRLFRVLDIYNHPIVKLQTSQGVELDSRWKTTAANRYILAVFNALPAQLEKLKATNAICEDGEVIGYENSPSRYRLSTPEKAIGCSEF